MKLSSLNSLLYFTAAVMLFFVAKVNAFEAKSISFDAAPIFQTDNGELQNLEGILTKPNGTGPFPAVVLLHTCGGPNDTTTKFWPEYLAEQGYVTLAVDSMGPRGISPGECLPLLKNKKPISGDAYGALEYLSGLPFVDKTKVGVIGYSLGGILINYFVRRNFKSPTGLNFRVGISIYGHCSSRRPGSAPYNANPRFPLVFILGDKEQASFFNSCNNVESLPNTERHVLAGVYHAFDNPDYTSLREDFAGNPMLYSKKGTKQAMEIVKTSLGKYLAKNAVSSNIVSEQKKPGGDVEPIGPAGRTASETISFMDKNDDEKISKSEWRGPERAFPIIDANNDGFLTKKEFNAKWR